MGEERAAAEMRWTKLPLGNMTSLPLRAAAAHLILSALWQKGTARAIWSSRHDRGWADSGAIPVKCFNDNGVWADARRAVANQPSMAAAAHAVLGKLSADGLDRVRPIVAADYGEHLSAWAVGLPNVAHFLE